MKFLGILFFFVFITLLYAKRQYHSLIIHQINCTINSQYVSHIECGLSEKKSVNLDITYVEDIKNYFVNFNLSLIRSPKGEILQTFDIDVDACQFLAGSTTGNLMSVMHEAFATYGNYPNRCPIKKNYSYYLHNFTLNMEHVPKIIPEFNFLVIISFRLPLKLEILRITARGSLIENAGNRFKNVTLKKELKRQKLE